MTWPCAECGGDNPDGTRFCGHCGAKRTADQAAPDLQATVADLAEVMSTSLAGERSRGEVVNRPLVERLASAETTVEERRLITAVFADVSGFTRLAHGLDAEQLVGIIGPIVSRLADIVTRYGGYVGKFAGDAILAFFGAPVSHEDDAVRALLAARDMQLESAELFASLGPEAQHLTLHVGVNTGYVVAGFFGDEVRMEYSVLGDAVNVAQRLESAAPGGAVYVGRDTYLLARSHFVFEDLGTIEVKGKPEPIPCWRLVAEAAGSGVASRSAAPAGRLVGRGREMAALTAALAPAAGGGGVAALVGEPGMGKSALLHEARRRGSEAGSLWVETHCVAYRSRPYRPYVELLRVIAEIPEEVEPRLAAGRIAEEAGRFAVPAAAPYFMRLLGLPLPTGTPDTTPADPLAFRQGLHDAVAAYIAARAGERRLVLSIEDVHWADPGTVDLTRHLATRARDGGFDILLTARPEGRATVVALADADGGRPVVEVGPLDDAAIHELAADVLGGPASAGLADIVTERTSGNPLFAHQLLRSLLDMEAVEHGPEGWRLRRGWSADAVPTAVEQVLAARIDLLPRPAADLLQVASVIGRDVHPALLRQVAGGARGHEETVELLVRGGFLDPVDDGGETRLFFRHVLLVDVAYGRLLRARRREIHRQVVAAVTALFGTGDDVVDMLARHSHRGEMGAQAVVYLERAGAHAASLFANEQAAAYLRLAIEIAERDADKEPRLAALLLRCAQVDETRGAYSEALDLYRRGQVLGGDVQAALGEASTLRKLGDYRGCLEVLGRVAAFGAALTTDERARLALEEGWVLGLTGNGPRAVEVLREGLRPLQGGENRTLEAKLLVLLARTEEMTGEYQLALGHVERARRLLDEDGDLPGLANALRVLGGVLYDVAASDRAGLQAARDALEQALELARRVGNAEEAAAALVNLGRTLSALGMHDDARRCDLEAVDAFAAVGNRTGVACAYCNLAEHLGEMGRWQESGHAARQGLAVAEEIGNGYWASGARIGIAESAIGTGDLREAATVGEAAFDLGVAIAVPARAESALRISVTALRGLGDVEAEQRLLAKARAAGVAMPDVVEDRAG
jgi:adenylate cyclase